MTAQISAYGRLVADPQTRTATTGTQMAMARLAVPLPCRAAQDGQATFWLGVVAFGRQAEALARHTKGDLVSVAGNMQINQWMGQDGDIQTGYQVVADSVISARTTRPSGRKGQQGQATNAYLRPKEQATPHEAEPTGWEVYQAPADNPAAPFDDDIPF